MRFGRTLRNSVYGPWKSHYIEYEKLKMMLREDEAPEGKPSPAAFEQAREWTEEDESAFVDELVNVQLENVNAFHAETYKHLQDRTSKCEMNLERLVGPVANRENGGSATKLDDPKDEVAFGQVMAELDDITKEINELEKYSRMNYTGFLKAAKKHDRKRGLKYRVRPLLQVRLAALPFNSEDYTPLLYRLSAIYSFVRQMIHGAAERSASTSNADGDKEVYKSHKFWVHPENFLEVKTYILRRLPVLVYNPQTSKIVESGRSDPTITSLYFDNPQFSLYTQKVGRTSKASSLRLRWSGHLEDKPQILLEKKSVEENGDSEEIRFPIKEKYVQPFIVGDYKLEKSIEKMRDRQGSDNGEVTHLERSVADIQALIKDDGLQPVLRANYTRTAFQIPGDDRVRISLDTNMAFIREDSLDNDRPCRNPAEWHREDIDNLGMDFPFSGIRQGEVSRFPYALLEIKVKNGATKRTNEWIADLMSSHLVKEAPRFSKYVHGVAQLFEDYVNSFPFWLSDLETDIRKDPEAAFQEEQEKKAKQAGNKSAVGSLLGSKSVSSFKAAVGSPADNSPTGVASVGPTSGMDDVAEEADSDDEPEQELGRTAAETTSRRRSFLPSFSSSKYARAHRGGSVQLPTGIKHPGQLSKDSGPVRVEPKVWLANQRTFIKWQHISVLLASLSLGLYNAAEEFNSVARGLALVYTLIAAFAGAWGWWMYIIRSRMIQERSGKDFDAVLGPIVICVSLVMALIINFGFKYRATIEKSHQDGYFNYTRKTISQDMSATSLPEWLLAQQGLRRCC